jgi:hypothetical protein
MNEKTLLIKISEETMKFMRGSMLLMKLVMEKMN